MDTRNPLNKNYTGTNDMKLNLFKHRNLASGTLNTLMVASFAMLGHFAAQDARAQAQIQVVAVHHESEIAHQEFNNNHHPGFEEYFAEVECLARNIYFEARGEAEIGQRAVAWVTLNRVQAERYPDTICGVVYQARRDNAGNPIRHQCQFSWYCDGRSDRIRNQSDWNTALQVAHSVIWQWGRFEDPTQGATMYHADYVDPYWADNYNRTVQIETHIFYAENNR
jgi:spore germination cell wall hydrolase CwlJ-like protein